MQSIELNQYFIFLFNVHKQRDNGIDELCCIVGAYNAEMSELSNCLLNEIIEKVGLKIIEHVLSKKVIEDDKCTIEGHKDSILLELVRI